MLGDPASARPEKKVLALDPEKRKFEIKSFPARLDGLSEAVTLHVKRFGSGLSQSDFFAIGPFREILGAEIESLVVEELVGFTAELEGSELIERPNRNAALLPLIAGRIETPTKHREVAIAVNGRIRSVTRASQEGVFETVVPAGVLEMEVNTVEVLLIDGTPDAPRLFRPARH